MKRLHLGAGKNALPSSDGWINVDQVQHHGIDVVFNLDECATKHLPFEDDSIDEFFGSHVIEHIHNTLALMQELHRVAKPDARMLLKCPFGGSDDADENPTHVRRYFIHSSGFWSQPFYWRESYNFHGDWITERIVLLIPERNAQGKDSDALYRDVTHQRNIVQEMHIYLRAVKPIREAKKELQTAPNVQFVLV